MRVRLAASGGIILFVLLTAALLTGVGVVAPAAVAATANIGPAATAASPPGSPLALLPRLAAQQAQMTAPDGALNDYFGYSVAISSDTAVVGVRGDDVGANVDQGSAYVFTRGGGGWSQQAQLTALDGAAGDEFGTSVDISGETVVIGAGLHDVGATSDQGAAYVFTRSGGVWSQQQKLTAGDGAAGDIYGWSVAVDGDTAVIGARDDDIGGNTNQGSAYVFARAAGVWAQQEKLITADGGFFSEFGGSVAIEGETIVVGAGTDANGANAEQGSAYVFIHNAVGWPQEAHLTAGDGEANDRFGSSVALSGDTVVVGARADHVGANADQGSAYVFVRGASTWSQQAHLIAADGAAGDGLGNAVTIDGETIVVTAPWNDVGTTVDQGSALVFGRRGTTWSRIGQLTAGDGAASDNFGYAAALETGTALVGDPFDTVEGIINRGSATVFTGVMALPARPAPRSPKGLISSRTPTFRWTTATGAATYQVRVYKGTRLIRSRTGIAKLSWKVGSALPRGVRLTWKVRAVNAGGAGSWSTKPWFKVR